MTCKRAPLHRCRCSHCTRPAAAARDLDAADELRAGALDALHSASVDRPPPPSQRGPAIHAESRQVMPQRSASGVALAIARRRMDVTRTKRVGRYTALPALPAPVPRPDHAHVVAKRRAPQPPDVSIRGDRARRGPSSNARRRRLTRPRRYAIVSHASEREAACWSRQPARPR